MSTATLNSEKRKVSVPKLRFQEFEGEWKQIKLGDYIKIKSGNSPSNYNFIDKGNYPFIKVEELNNCNKYQNSSRFYSNENKNLVEKFSVIFPKRGAAILNNKVRINDCPIFMDSNMMAIIPKRNQLHYEFLYYKIVKEELYKIADTSSIPQINNKHIEPYKLFITSLPEQQKIASFLSAVDEKIQQLSRKKELLKQYKNGVMQQLFSGKLRFKDENGKDYPDWEEKKLGDVAEKRIVKNKDNKINLVFTNSAMQGIVNQRDYFDKDIANQNNLLGYYIVENNDFVYNPRISTYAPVGPISRNYLDTGIMSPLYSVFRFKYGNLDFLEFFFNSIVWHKHMKDISNYGARDDRMSFSTSDFYKMPIPFPSFEEQQKIAGFLSSIDSKIESVNQQLAQTRTFKKGLLQQMFV
ncbi:MAG TPA: restriction endonuclease subunit S [Flavobacterium sp.]|nr:restriction endonuclease subunit S [Flavobacterium sp.]